MAQGKKSFVLYCDLIHTVKKLPNEKAGELFKHILSYVNDENPDTDDLVINISFEPIKQQLKRDLKKYESICERNSLNGSKGGRPKLGNPEEPKKPTGLFGNPEEPKKADNDNDNDNDITKEFDLFWDKYHLITKRKKEDKEATITKWNKLTKKEKQKAIDNIQNYYNSLKDKEYSKKARTYLSAKNFNDEFVKVAEQKQYRAIDSWADIDKK